MKEKSLKDISWNVSEEVYREDEALSYSTLATFERGGFNCLDTLKDKKESPALTFGSAVDAIITGGQEEFDNRFIVAKFPTLSDKAFRIVKDLFAENHITAKRFNDISENKVLEVIERYEYWNNCKAETKIKKLNDEGVDEYYDLLQLADSKIVLSDEVYSDVLASVRALKESSSTKDFFADDNPFNDNIEHLYQLKFKAVLNGIEYRCMSDLLVVDHEHKIIYPIDLKTSSHTEWDFFKSFVQWDYQIQARLYWRIIRAVLDKDPYFKDFSLDKYRFIVVNKTTLTPLVWLFDETTTVGDITMTTHSNKLLTFRDPEAIGIELSSYLKNKPTVPSGICQNGDNHIMNWLRNAYD